MTDPDQILAQYEGKLAEAQRKSDAIREGLANLRVTERSPDGQISVTLNDAGNIVDLQLGNSLQRKEGQAVAQDIMRVIQTAQSRVAGAVQEAMSPLIGDDSEAMDFMMSNLRSAQPPPPPRYISGGGGYGADTPRFGIEDDAPPPPPPAQRPPAPRPPSRPQSPPDDDDDFGGGFLR